MNNSRKLNDIIFNDGIETGLLRALKIARSYKVEIFDDKNIKAFEAICVLEEKLQNLKNS